MIQRILLARFLAITMLVANAGVTLATAGTAEQDFEVASALDSELVSAVGHNDLVRVRELLASGANPDASITGDRNDSAMCLATRHPASGVLEALLAGGADPDQFFEKAKNFYRVPLACAVSWQNTEAFDLLVEYGADVTVNLCPECGEPFSFFESTVLSHHHETLWRLLQLTRPTARDIDTLLFCFEHHGHGPTEWHSPDRARVIAWVREQGIEINPKVE